MGKALVWKSLARVQPRQGREAVLVLGMMCWIAWMVVVPFVGSPAANAQSVGNCVKIELYIREGLPQCDQARNFLANLEKRRPGVRVDVYDVAKDAAALARLRGIAASAGREAQVPTVSACGQLVVGFRDEPTTGAQIESLLTMEVFVREGCPRCAAALPYLAGIQQRYPGLRVAIYEVTRDYNAQNRMNSLTAAYQMQAGIPTVHFGGRLIVGWSGLEITGGQIEGLLVQACGPCRAVAAPPTPAEAAPSTGSSPAPPSGAGPSPTSFAIPHALELIGLVAWDSVPPGDVKSPPPPSEESPPVPVPVPIPIPVPVPTPIPLPVPVPPPPRLGEFPGEVPPDLPGEASPGESEVVRPLSRHVPETITVPVLGTLDVRGLGLPLFTFAIGLVDGFNPCAMWVLVFLLSVLAGLNDRKKMVAVAGTFVFVSGLAYFVFMAAWLNVFLLIGYVRWAQIALGGVALMVGAVHIKDFFAFHQGISFSIPDSAKPGIYARVRRIVAAESLLPALGGAVVLAVLVNTVELLCTAGLPALYTQILTAQGFPWWLNYGYLGLYILAYMFDDTLLLLTVVATLSRRRLQEKEGRWLKLVSGVVILALGVVMLVKPEWLV